MEQSPHSQPRLLVRQGRNPSAFPALRAAASLAFSTPFFHLGTFMYMLFPLPRLNAPTTRPDQFVPPYISGLGSVAPPRGGGPRVPLLFLTSAPVCFLYSPYCEL